MQIHSNRNTQKTNNNHSLYQQTQPTKQKNKHERIPTNIKPKQDQCISTSTCGKKRNQHITTKIHTHKPTNHQETHTTSTHTYIN